MPVFDGSPKEMGRVSDLCPWSDRGKTETIPVGSGVRGIGRLGDCSANSYVNGT